jgi:hypothetical protein
MKKNNLKSILTDLAEHAAPPDKIDLWPAIQSSLEPHAQPLHPGESNMNRSIPRLPLLRRAVFILLVLMLAGAALLATRQGRALAQKMWLFFRVTDEKSFILPTDQVFAVPATFTPAPTHLPQLLPVEEETQLATIQITDPSSSTAAIMSDYFSQVNAVESQAGFDVKEFLYDPKGTEFSKVTYAAETNQVTMEFEVTTGGGYLVLRQGITEYVPADDPWSKVPSEAVTQATVNENYAEMASGTYVVYPNAASAVWEPGGQLSLVWREGKHWFVLEKWGDPYPIEWITREELIKLAESLVPERPVDAAPALDPENLKSVAEAEKLAGFDVLTPGLLPEGYELKRAAWIYDSVRLFYGPQNSKEHSLIIVMGPLANNQIGPCPDCPPSAEEAAQVGPWQGWYLHGSYFIGSSEEGQPTPTPEWQTEANNWGLAWYTDQLWISITFWPSEEGEVMTKELLIAIAESMK